jgi:hypothetical protein
MVIACYCFSVVLRDFVVNKLTAWASELPILQMIGAIHRTLPFLTVLIGVDQCPEY